MGNTERRNVVVIGAGASKEFNLPTGEELKDKISKISDIEFDDFNMNLLRGDPDIVRCLYELSNNRDISAHLEAAWQIRNNMPLAPSIDNFLHTHQENNEIVEFGKVAIVKAILDAEAKSLLLTERNNQGNYQLKANSVKDTWLSRLFQILVAGRSFDDFLKAMENITFISFNYDRCIHQFIFHAAKSYFGLGASQDARLIQTLDILYPYGSIGEFQHYHDGQTNFGAKLREQQLVTASKRIRTFTEGSEPERVSAIHEAFEAAEVAIFLGFGFLPLNMELLFGEEMFEAKKVLATSFGMSENSKDTLTSELSKIFAQWDEGFIQTPIAEEDLRVMDCTCSNLVHEFERYLAV